jgi:tRNA-2-methylthio-N6-dimethylallyladenosine synthase
MSTAVTPPSAAPRTYEIRTYGCQMNVHDSERLAGLLETAGYQRAVDAGAADVVVFNTCAVRENADNRLYGSLGHLRSTKRSRPGMQIAVGGCLAQKDQHEIVHRAPWVDVVFGTHNLGALPVLLERARVREEAQVEIVEALQTHPSNLPTSRDSAYAAWVSVSVGCNNTCTFCIVPALRGKEVDRRPGEILAEIEMLVADGVQEITPARPKTSTPTGSTSAIAAPSRSCAPLRGDPRTGAGAVHLASSPGLHRRGDRGHGRDAQRDAVAAHAAAVRFGRRAAGDAPVVSE